METTTTPTASAAEEITIALCEEEKKTVVKLTHDLLDVSEATDSVLSERCGGTSIFIGTTRDNFRGKKVVELEYECYEEMAYKEIGKICTQIRLKYPNIMHICVYHRLGKVPVKESSIIVASSSAHRADAIEATSVCVDLVKSNVPVWKKEVYADGTSEWMSNKECCWSGKK